tara:strand:- start:350 stop:526 length:177 start_codon:yes stop_codon:yes gene_type:complete
MIAIRSGVCPHMNRHYKPADKKNNIPESYKCEDCGVNIKIPSETISEFMERCKKDESK